jgi:membrane-associated phospholipid phosphatase
MRFGILLVVLATLALVPTEPSHAQTNSQPSLNAMQSNPELPDSPTPASASVKPQEKHPKFLPTGENPENRLVVPFMKHLARDQEQFWTAPFHLNRDDAKLLIPFAAFTGGLIAGDRWISRQIPNSQINRSKSISDYATYSFIGAAGASYLWGHFTRNDHLRETGLLASEAALNSAAVAYLFKTVTQRPRPLDGNGNGTFFQGGGSFPSEHSAIAWSVASVVAHEYPGTLTKIVAYGLASAVTITRVTGKQHFSSDVVVGSALGWYFARQIYRAHHDPELGGAGWGTFEHSDSDSDKKDKDDKIRNPEYMGSPNVPLDSWVYPAVEKLVSLGYIKAAFLSLKPWTRIETASLVNEVQDNLVGDDVLPAEVAGIQRRLEQEFAYELRLLDGKSNETARIESIYIRPVSISGPALTDSYHLGQTISYDYGRPFREGTNGQVGTSMWAAAGPFAVYVRGEFQHAPYAPPLSNAVLNVIGLRDMVPVPPATPFAQVNRPHLLEGYASLTLDGWQISAGKESLDWGPGPGGSLLWSNNADPVEMVRIAKSDMRLPILGSVRVDQFIGMLRGHDIIPHPYIYGQKINFKPLPWLELGFGRTVTIGGRGGNPLTFSNFADSFFGRVNQTKSVPGDTHTSMDWVFYIPKVRNYLVFYGELYADDDPLPIVNPPKNPYRPGIYLTHFPGIPKLDLHLETVSTESPGFFNFGGPNKGNLNYWNQLYRDGYTNEGNLIGNTVGRMGSSIQGWLTYWMSSASTLQFSFKTNSVSANFIPGGGDWQDYRLNYNKYLKSGLYWKSQVQYEHISRYPILFNSSRGNVAAIVEFGWAPTKR